MVSETITITIWLFTMVAWLVLVPEAKTSQVVVFLFFLFQSSFQNGKRRNYKETGCLI